MTLCELWVSKTWFLCSTLGKRELCPIHVNKTFWRTQLVNKALREVEMHWHSYKLSAQESCEGHSFQNSCLCRMSIVTGQSRASVSMLYPFIHHLWGRADLVLLVWAVDVPCWKPELTAVTGIGAIAQQMWVCEWGLLFAAACTHLTRKPLRRFTFWS